MQTELTVNGAIGTRRADGSLYDAVVFAFLYWFALQDFALALFYHVTGLRFATEILFYSKDLFLVGFFAISLFKEKIPVGWIGWLAAWFFVLTVYFFVGYVRGNGLFSLAGMTRNLLCLPCLATIGYGVTREGERSVARYMTFLVVCGAFGLADMALDALVGTKDFWRDTVGLTDFLADIKRQSGLFLYEGLPGNFYGDYGGGFFTQKRLVGVFANPLTSAYVLVVPYFYYLLRACGSTRKKGERRRASIACCLLFFMIALTFTRAIILPAVLFTLVILFVKFPKCRIPLAATATAAVALGTLVFYREIAVYLFGGSTGAHYDALVRSFSSFDLFGQGIGSYGIYGEIATESSYFNVLGQLGIVGLVLYLIGNGLLIRAAFRKWKQGVRPILSETVLVLSAVYFITGFVSEQLFAYTSIAPFYLLAGMLMGSPDRGEIPARATERKTPSLTSRNSYGKENHR